MEIAEPTIEQRQRFQQEFADYWNSLDHGPHSHHGDRTNNERTWCLARAYSEQLQMEAFPCPDCGIATVNVGESGDVVLECLKCGWKFASIEDLASPVHVEEPNI